MIKHVIVPGTLSALGLGIFLWFMEELTGKKVYTLLLNVDFIPIIGNDSLPLMIEWFFHIVISWGITMIIVLLLHTQPNPTNSFYFAVVFVLTSIACLSYIPLTLVSVKETPNLFDFQAILYWIIGHILYAIILKKSICRIS
ncbi:hypothetical protein [Aquibacillus saliphilus]|uniref:hypothetical protein n=1 Tax=Aquibacillus saliphilus TaxID=1909422 RepID=UPI001CEFBE25|nr:hypothetical protein [Aquibacillus saliphilus]